MQTIEIEKINVAIKQDESCKDIPLPKYMSDSASGMDMYAACEKNIVLKPLERTLVPTGISIALPIGYEAQIRPRSGLALKKGISVVNTPGTIDADYRGKIGIILINLSNCDFIVERGMRIAQMVFQPIVHANFKIVSELSETERNSGGFGHTGH